jgi:siroheme synthase-like protein
MAILPIFLELRDRPCLVIGAGPVAFRKASALAACGAKVTVVGPVLSAGMRRLVRQGKVVWRPRRFRPEDLKGMELVVAATDESVINEQAAQEARARRVWINVVDQPRLCSFYFPSIVRRGKLVLAISTTGVSPALAKWIRRDLERRYGTSYRELLEVMARWRGEVQRNVKTPRQRKKLFEEALQAYLQVLKRGGALP